MLGKSLRQIQPHYIYLDSSTGDLRDSKVVAAIFDREKPDKIIHAAARVGGIQDNVQFPYKYFADNILMNANVVDAAVKRQIPVVGISSTCVYPASSEIYPMTEEMALMGDPEPTNYGYAFSKRAMHIQLEAARREFNLPFALLFLTNLYGEDDHYENETKAHLVTALIKKMHRAKMENASEVNLLGTGRPMRQFLYAPDAARAIVEIVEADVFDVFNIAPETNPTVREISETVAEIIGFNGALNFNGQLDGVLRKDVTAAKLKNQFPRLSFLSLAEGVRKTYEVVRKRL